jgi:hypothetical protein
MGAIVSCIVGRALTCQGHNPVVRLHARLPSREICSVRLPVRDQDVGCLQRVGANEAVLLASNVQIKRGECEFASFTTKQ